MTNDLISRQAAIDIVRRDFFTAYTAEERVSEIMSIPTTEPRKGKWEVVDEAEPRRYGCSYCKRLSWDETNFCSYCGAKMEEA